MHKNLWWRNSSNFHLLPLENRFLVSSYISILFHSPWSTQSLQLFHHFREFLQGFLFYFLSFSVFSMLFTVHIPSIRYSCFITAAMSEQKIRFYIHLNAVNPNCSLGVIPCNTRSKFCANLWGCFATTNVYCSPTNMEHFCCAFGIYLLSFCILVLAPWRSFVQTCE